MKTSSCKAKGRALQNHVASALQNSFRLPPADVRPAIMGDSGADIKLSSKAKELIPFDIECKNQERLNIWQAIKQAESNTEEGRIPLLIFKRNRSRIYAVLEFEKLLKLTQQRNENAKQNAG